MKPSEIDCVPVRLKQACKEEGFTVAMLEFDWPGLRLGKKCCSATEVSPLRDLNHRAILDVRIHQHGTSRQAHRVKLAGLFSQHGRAS